MKKTFSISGLALLAGISLAACSPQYEGFNEADLQRFYTVMVAHDCRVTIETSDAIEAESGLSYEKLEAIADHLKERGKMVLIEDELGADLIHEACP